MHEGTGITPTTGEERRGSQHGEERIPHANHLPWRSTGPGPQDTLPFNQRTQGQERQWSHTDRWHWQDTSEHKCWHKKCKVAYKVAQTWLVSQKATVPSHRHLKNGLLIPTDYNEGKHSCPSMSNCAINTRVWGQITSGRLRRQWFFLRREGDGWEGDELQYWLVGRFALFTSCRGVTHWKQTCPTYWEQLQAHNPLT